MLNLNRKAGQRLTNHAKNSLAKAEFLAKKFNSAAIQNIHLLFAVFLEKGSIGENILKDLQLKKEDFLAVLGENNFEKTPRTKSVGFSEEFRKTFTRAFSAANNFNYTYVGTEHFIWAIVESADPLIKKIMAKSTPKKLRQSIKSFFEPGKLPGSPQAFNLPEMLFAKPGSTSSSATPFIDKFCLDINKDAQNKGEVIIGREKELDRIINILGRKNKNNPLLIGEPGVGKTALIAGLAQLINAGSVPSFLYGKKIMNLDVAQLIAGTSFRGEFELRLKEILKEAAQNKDIIIFIDEIHNIIGAGNVSGSLDLANIIKPALARGEIQIIGATTFVEYKKHIERDAALERRFQPVQIKEPTQEETEKILLGIKGNYEKFHNVFLDDDTIRLAVELSLRYIQNRFLPDKAIDTIDETASNVRSKNNISDFMKELKDLENRKNNLLAEKEKLIARENYEKAIAVKNEEKELDARIEEFKMRQAKIEKENQIKITAADILETISKISGIPLEKISRESNEKIKNIKKILAAQILGQGEVIEKLSHVLLRSQAGISNPDRPLGSFLFLGPTGVGKTLTAKILAEEFFNPPTGGQGSLIRIDMSELMERHSVSSLIGSPAGYIGYGEGGNLTEKVRRNPYSVILFDEIEKAHPDVFNILLQILEDGTLTDAEGTKVNFKNTIIILTSNIGTGDFTDASGKIGFGKKEISKKFDAIKENTLKELRLKMKPELLNRLDYILVFNSLGKKEMKEIAKLELEKLSQRLKKQEIALVFKDAVLDLLIEKSLAENQGARLIRKNIQDLIENEIAEVIVHGKVKNKKISLNVVNKKIVIR